MDKKEALYWEDVPSYYEGSRSVEGRHYLDTEGVFTQRARISGGWLYRALVAEPQIHHLDVGDEVSHIYVSSAVSITFVPS